MGLVYISFPLYVMATKPFGGLPATNRQHPPQLPEAKPTRSSLILVSAQSYILTC